MKCNSPNVLKCYEILQNKQVKILVLEYCSGKSLEEYCKNKKLTEKEAVPILRQIMNGLAVIMILFRSYISMKSCIETSRGITLWSMKEIIRSLISGFPKNYKLPTSTPKAKTLC